MSLEPIGNSNTVSNVNSKSSEAVSKENKNSAELSEALSNSNKSNEKKYEYKTTLWEDIKRVWGKVTGDIDDVEMKPDGTKITTVMNSRCEEYLEIVEKPNGFTTVTERTYDKDLVITKAVIKDSNKTVTEEFYNSEERVIKSKTTYADGRVVIKEFDSWGNLISEENSKVEN